MDIYQRKREANLMSRRLIEKALNEGKEISIDKLMFSVLDEYPVPEKPLRSAIYTYVGMQKGIVINEGIIKKDD